LRNFLDLVEEKCFNIAQGSSNIANEIKNWSINQYNAALVNLQKESARREKAKNKKLT
jgi:hypothetical protein